MYKTNAAGSIKLSDRHIDWNFPDKISKKKKKGFSVRGFTFTFPDITNSMKNLLEPSVDLIN